MSLPAHRNDNHSLDEGSKYLSEGENRCEMHAEKPMNLTFPNAMRRDRNVIICQIIMWYPSVGSFGKVADGGYQTTDFF